MQKVPPLNKPDQNLPTYLRNRVVWKLFATRLNIHEYSTNIHLKYSRRITKSYKTGYMWYSSSRIRGSRARLLKQSYKSAPVPPRAISFMTYITGSICSVTTDLEGLRRINWIFTEYSRNGPFWTTNFYWIFRNIQDDEYSAWEYSVRYVDHEWVAKRYWFIVELVSPITSIWEKNQILYLQLSYF